MKTCFNICAPLMLHFSDSKKLQQYTNLRRSSYTVLVIFVLFQPNVNFLKKILVQTPNIKFH